MKVVHINTTDLGGGAEQVMLGLHHGLVSVGHQSVCLVGKKQTKLDFVRELLSPTYIQRLLNEVSISQGREPMAFRNVAWQFSRVGFEPDVVHIHNLHGGYFDLNNLVQLSQRYKVFVHLHDMWLLTGHCAQSFTCDGWQSGCGNCPDLTIYPSIRKDATDFNWMRKRDILARCELNFICPSQWLADRVKVSQIAYKSLTVMPNGVDVMVFKQGDKSEARKALGIDISKKVLLFIAKNPEKNEFKDCATLVKAAELASEKLNGKVELICLGSSSRNVKIEKVGNLTISFHPFTQDKNKVVQYYQAADLYIHSAKAETFGNTIIEAMACGAPIIASDIGGIPEIIENEVNGLLFSQGNVGQLDGLIVRLLSDQNKMTEISSKASEIVGTKFDMKKLSNRLIELYQNV